LGLRSFQITASFPIILCSTLFCQSCPFTDRKLFAPTDREARTAIFELLAFVGFDEFFADFLGHTAEATFRVGGGLHQTMLGGRFAWHINLGS
jgi:hypothetical protein